MKIRMTFPGGDSAAIMKLRGMHLPSTRFWKEWGFIDPKTGYGRRPLVSHRRARSVGDWPV